MDDYIGRYEKTIRKLIKTSYPVLKNKKIKIYEKKNLKFSADATPLFFFMRIRTHPRLRNYSYNKLVGIFAHELCHLQYYSNFSFRFSDLIDLLKRVFSNKYDEAEADKCAIKKGYGR